MPRSRPYSDRQLLDAADAAPDLRTVVRRLGLTPGGRTYERLRRELLALGIDDPRLHDRTRRSGRTWTDAELADAVTASRSINEVLRRLGLRPGGSVYPMMRREFERLDLDVSHFTGQAWARGHRFPGRRMRPLDALLVAGSDYLNTHRLKQRMIAAGLLVAECAICRLQTWNGRPAPLQLDHVNGDRRDNRVQNLRLLCPNCHAQTETFCGRNIGRG